MQQRPTHCRGFRTGSSFRGFTLIELLVVISIIGLLVSLLLPALSEAKKAAKMSLELSNMRQVGVAVHTYAADNESALPGGNTQRYYNTATPRTRLGEGKYLVGEVSPNKFEVWGCPLMLGNGMKESAVHSSSWGWTIGNGGVFHKDGGSHNQSKNIGDGSSWGGGSGASGEDDYVTVDGLGLKKKYAPSDAVIITDSGICNNHTLEWTNDRMGHVHNYGRADESVQPPNTNSWMLDGHAETRTPDQLLWYSVPGGAWW